jgi:hypothetical protein
MWAPPKEERKRKKWKKDMRTGHVQLLFFLFVSTT